MKENGLAAVLPEQAMQQPDNAADEIREEIVHGYTDTTLNYNYTRRWGSFPTKDGRYIYWKWNPGSRRMQKIACDNVPEELFAILSETDRYATNLIRKDEENGDNSAFFEDSGEMDDGTFHRSALDRAACQQWLAAEAQEESERLYPDEVLKKHFRDGDYAANNQRWRMRLKVIEQIIPQLTIKQKDTFIKYYGMLMSEEAIGMEDGVEKQAVENRLVREIKPVIRKIFERLGFEVPTPEELAAEEAAARRRRKEEKKKAKEERERRRKEGIPDPYEEEKEIRCIHAVANGLADEETYIETGQAEPCHEEGKDIFAEDYDPDNPDDYISDDFDPYEDPRYKEAEKEEEDFWEEFWEE